MDCPPCREFFRQNKKAIRWIAFFTTLAGFFFWLGTISAPVNTPGFCRVYY